MSKRQEALRAAVLEVLHSGATYEAAVAATGACLSTVKRIAKAAGVKRGPGGRAEVVK